ncbi:MAG: PHP domain-containing protein [Spirochaetes bacterium]|nr:PHP domain-containing protein [Spirochaetota bacterium]
MLQVDLHIHSINSGHAYGTFYDIVSESLTKKMKLIALTDHGPSLAGTSGPVHFHLGKRAPKKIEDLRILWGCEANLINGAGELDLDEYTIDKLDILLIGIHPFTQYQDLGKLGNTQALIQAIERYPVNVLTHPLHQQFEYDWEPVWECAFSQNTLLELNLSYMIKYIHRDLEKFKTMIEFVKKHNQKIIINSDAHFVHEIGDDTILQQYQAELRISDDLIFNDQLDKIYQWLNLED